MVCFGNKIRLSALFLFFLFSFFVYMCIDCECVCVCVRLCACSVPKIGHQFLIWCSKIISFSFYGHSQILHLVKYKRFISKIINKFYLYSFRFFPLYLIVYLNMHRLRVYLSTVYLPTYIFSFTL